MTDDEEKIEYLFYKGYTYEEIVGLLSVDFGIQMSLKADFQSSHEAPRSSLRVLASN
jgi:hypothetical protein